LEDERSPDRDLLVPCCGAVAAERRRFL